MRRKKYHFKKVILIIADTLRQINLEDSNPHRAKTPNIDWLKKNGVSFTNAYTTITKTDPSVTAIMTGKYPVHNGLVNHGELVTRDEEKNIQNSVFLAEILKKNGFNTVAADWLGRWHKRGFDYYSGKLGSFRSMEFRFESIPLLFNLYELRKLTVRLLRKEFFMRFYYCFSKNPKIPYDPADKVIQKGIELLKKYKSKKTFLYLHLWDAHEPHTNPKGLRSYLFDNVDKTYNAEINFIDSQIGKLLNHLIDSKLINETLIIFTSDHGENFYESGSPFYHDQLYENVVKIPIILSNPQLPSKKLGCLAQNVDILPTCLDLLGIKIKNRFDGASLFPVIANKKKEVRLFAFFEDIYKERRFQFLNRTRRKGIKIGNYKYIETIKGRKKDLTKLIPEGKIQVINRELYNLKNDSKEKNNLIKTKVKTTNILDKQLEEIITRLGTLRLQEEKKKFQRINYTKRTNHSDKEIILSRLRALGY